MGGDIKVKAAAKAVVVGGGIAGLVAAAQLRQAGAEVVVLEGAASLGGRARTLQAAGFSFNQGAHALYSEGAFYAALKQLGVAAPGQAPRLKRAMALYQDKLFRLPTSLSGLAETKLLSAGDKLAFGRRLQLLTRKGERPSGAFARWLDGQHLSPSLRACLEALARLTTYADAPSEMSAAAALEQIRLGLAGVVYVDGGWITLVDGLAARARSTGVELRTGAMVASIAPSEAGVEVLLADGEAIAADAVLLAIGPHEAAGLLPAASLKKAAAEATPARANVLDLGLERMPAGAHGFVLGIDRALYLSAHSEAAKLAPEGAALVSLVRYLAPGEAPAAGAIAELEALADLAMPGWRPLERKRHWLVGMPVANGLPRWDLKRPGVRLADAPGVFIAGDWVGEVGMISDAAAASASEAATAMLERMGLADRAAA